MPGINLPSNLPGLEKMLLTSFTDVGYQNAKQSMVVMYNPTAFSQGLKINWEAVQTQGAPNGQLKFKAIDSDNVSFEFLFDATGASPSGSYVPGNVQSALQAKVQTKYNVADIVRNDKHVDGAIKKFMELSYNVDSETHQPHYLQINWGAFEFRGVLESATINYKLFNNAGLPIRATVSATFKKCISSVETTTDPPTSSPDLTHYRMVEGGDTLPIMTYRIYEDPMLYLEVARANKINNFRKLKTGQKVAFPPIKEKQNK